MNSLESVALASILTIVVAGSALLVPMWMRGGREEVARRLPAVTLVFPLALLVLWIATWAGEAEKGYLVLPGLAAVSFVIALVLVFLTGGGRAPSWFRLVLVIAAAIAVALFVSTVSRGPGR